MKRPIIPVVGHRGAAALWPENTMYAFREAEKLGVDGLETDIRMTRDGELVLCHDERVDRTTDGTGRVCDLSLRELRALDAGRPFCGGPTGLRIPTLEAFLDWAAGTGLFLNLEIKDARRKTVEKTMRTIDRYRLAGRYVITSFDLEVCRHVRAEFGAPVQGFVHGRLINDRPDAYRLFYAVGIGLAELSRELVRELREEGLRPWCWCPGTEQQVRRAVDCGAELCTCNDPRSALALLRREGLHP